MSPVDAKDHCFVIAPIGPEGTEIRRKSDQVLKHIVKKALQEKYEVRRADEIGLPGIITVQVIEALLKAPLVVADLSDGNPNVYYELAIRHLAKKPVVHLIKEGQEVPFDVNQIRCIKYDITDPDSSEKAREQLIEQVRAIENGHPVHTPAQFAQNLMSMSAQGGLGEQLASVAQTIQSGLSYLHEELLEIKHRLPSSGPAGGSNLFANMLREGPDLLLSSLLTGENATPGDKGAPTAPKGHVPAKRRR